MILKNVLLLVFLGSVLNACVTAEKENKLAELTSAQRTPANHSWGGYHWARTTPTFNLRIGDNLTLATWKTHLSQTSQDWNSPQLFQATSTPITTVIETGRSKANCSMVPGTTQVCNKKYGSNGWLGLASINIIDGTHITQGSAKMNDTYFNTAKYNNANERQHVMCQEIAHTFGLSHQSEDGSSQNSCMDYFSNTGVNATSTVSTRPNAHDFEVLNEMYAHLDTKTTLAANVTFSSTSDVTDNSQSWGHLIRQSKNGRHSIYERINRDNSQTITHVYWTEEKAAKCPQCDHRE